MRCRAEHRPAPAPSWWGAQQAGAEAEERDTERRGSPFFSAFASRPSPSQNSGHAIAINVTEAGSDPKIRKQRGERSSLRRTATRLQQGRTRWSPREPRLLVA